MYILFVKVQLVEDKFRFYCSGILMLVKSWRKERMQKLRITSNEHNIDFIDKPLLRYIREFK